MAGGREKISHNISSTSQLVEQDTPTTFGRVLTVTYDDTLEEYYDTVSGCTAEERQEEEERREEDDNDVQEILDPKTAALRR